VVELGLAVLYVAAGVGPLGNVVAFEHRADGKDDIGELCLVLHPNRLIDDELDGLVAIGVDQTF
jgi:hypothetical protein